MAEVLVSLGIIGIIAALTIPAVIERQNEREAVSRLKKIYSTFSQAFNWAVSEEGTPDGWNIGTLYDYEGSRRLYKPIAKHLIVIKDCGNTENGCHKGFQRADGMKFHFDNEKGVTFQMNDGVVAGIFTRYEDCKGASGQIKNICGDLTVDINGMRGPNILGKDLFRFHITKNGIIPKGSQQEMSSPNIPVCLESGEGCTAWVIYNENMDYLHCNDLNWNTKTKCR